MCRDTEISINASKIWKGRLPHEKKIVWDGGASSKIAGLGISISQNTLFDQFSEKKICVGSPLGK